MQIACCMLKMPTDDKNIFHIMHNAINLENFKYQCSCPITCMLSSNMPMWHADCSKCNMHHILTCQLIHQPSLTKQQTPAQPKIRPHVVPVSISV